MQQTSQLWWIPDWNNQIWTWKCTSVHIWHHQAFSRDWGISWNKLGQRTALPKPNKPKVPLKNLRPIIFLSILRNILVIIVVNRTFQRIRTVISVSQAAYSPGHNTTQLVFAIKVLTEKAMWTENYTIYLLILDMSRAFDTIDRGTLLHDLSDILNPVKQHLLSLFLLNVQLQVKYNNIQ